MVIFQFATLNYQRVNPDFRIHASHLGIFHMSKLLRHLGSFARPFLPQGSSGPRRSGVPRKVGFKMPWLQPSKTKKKKTETNCWMYTSHFPRLALCQGSRAVVQSGGQFTAAYVSKLLSEAASMNWLDIPTCLCFGRNGINQWNLKIAKEVLRASLTLQLQHAEPVKKPHLLMSIWVAGSAVTCLGAAAHPMKSARVAPVNLSRHMGHWRSWDDAWHCVHSVWPHGISATKCRVSWQMGHLPLMPWGVALDLPGALAGIFHSAQISTFTFIPRFPR